MGSKRTAGQKVGLSTKDLLQASRRLLADSGGDGFTMRAVARELGVAPNTLYSHVESKAALIDAVLDDLLAAVPSPPPETPSRVGLRQIMIASYEVLVAHSSLVPLVVARGGARGAHAWRLGNAMTEFLISSGLDTVAAEDARHALIVYTIGSAAYSSASTPPGEPSITSTGDRSRSAFESGLDWLLAGILGGLSISAR